MGLGRGVVGVWRTSGYSLWFGGVGVGEGPYSCLRIHKPYDFTKRATKPLKSSEETRSLPEEMERKKAGVSEAELQRLLLFLKKTLAVKKWRNHRHFHFTDKNFTHLYIYSLST